MNLIINGTAALGRSLTLWFLVGVQPGRIFNPINHELLLSASELKSLLLVIGNSLCGYCV